MKQIRAKKVDVKKLLRASLWMNMIQLVLIIVVIVYALMSHNTDLYSLIYVALGITALNGVITIGWYRFTFQSKSESLMETLENLEALNSKLREQRHDYLNHIQVIYGLLELEEYQEARKYMEPVYKDILKVSKALKTSHPAINALLQAKMQMAQNCDIDLYLEIKSNLKDIPLEPWELCKVLSNLIDNGMSALEKKQGIRNMYIDVNEDLGDYEICIYNNGPEILEEHLEKIFEEGFTTKDEPDHGMGLYIVRTIIEGVGGQILVTSNADKTAFTVYLPKMTVGT